MEKTATTKGLSVIVRLNLTHYEKGILIHKEQIDNQRIFYNKVIPQLSYRITSQNSVPYLFYVPYSIWAYIKLEKLKVQTSLNHFQIKAKIYSQALKVAYLELANIKRQAIPA